jgi:hypothetical protein
MEQAVTASARHSAFIKQNHLHAMNRRGSDSISKAVCISAKPTYMLWTEEAVTASARKSTFLKQNHLQTVKGRSSDSISKAVCISQGHIQTAGRWCPNQ